MNCPGVPLESRPRAVPCVSPPLPSCVSRRAVPCVSPRAVLSRAVRSRRQRAPVSSARPPRPAGSPGPAAARRCAVPSSDKGHVILQKRTHKCVTECIRYPDSVLFRFLNQPKCAVCSKAQCRWAGFFSRLLCVYPKSSTGACLFCGFASSLPASTTHN